MKFTPTDRIAALPPYLFVEIDRRKRAAIAAGRDVITFGVGDPDRPTPEFIVERLRAAAGEPANHRYPHDLGSPEFREAIGQFVQRRYGVTLNPATEILTLIGSKEGLGHLPLAVVNPGATVLVPDPGYPVYTSATIFAGGKVVKFDLTDANDWLPDLSAISSDIARSAVLMFVNYPNNPLGAVAPKSFYRDLVAFAREHEIVIAQDAAYNEMYFGEPPHSILEIDGAKDVAVEFHSASKTFNMTGWRLGFVAGNADVIAALARIKSNLDSGQFTAVQDAGIAAYERIDGPEVQAMRAEYAERAKRMAAGLTEMGFRVREPVATFYIWAGVPSSVDSMTASMRLLEEADVIAIPGSGFGRNGEGYVRFAMTVELDRIDEALRRMKRMSW